MTNRATMIEESRNMIVYWVDITRTSSSELDFERDNESTMHTAKIAYYLL